MVPSKRSSQSNLHVRFLQICELYQHNSHSNREIWLFCKKCNTFSLFPFAIEEVCHIIHRMYNFRSFVSEKYETAELVPTHTTYHPASTLDIIRCWLLLVLALLGLFFWNPFFVISFFFCCSRKGPMDQILPQFGLKNIYTISPNNVQNGRPQHNRNDNVSLPDEFMERIYVPSCIFLLDGQTQTAKMELAEQTLFTMYPHDN